MDLPPENDPAGPPEKPAVPEEMPSVVGSRNSAGVWVMVLCGCLLVYLGVLVFKDRRSGDQHSSASAPDLDAPAAPVTSTGGGRSGVSVPLPPALTETIVPPKTDASEEKRALLEIRRKSPMIIFNAGSASSSVNPAGGGPPTGGAPVGGAPVGGAPVPAGFLPSAAAGAHATQLGDRTCMIAQGKLIDAVLESAINSDHPGMLRALVSEDIYADNGNVVLLPRGSRLIGEYDSGVARGQNRIFVLWERSIRPDGVDIQLLSAGTDSLGRTGVEGEVNNHFLTMFGAATLLSVIGASAANVGVHAGDNANSAATYREGIANGFADASNTVLGEFVRIKPTITVKQGQRIKVFVAKDLYFDGTALDANHVRFIW